MLNEIKHVKEYESVDKTQTKVLNKSALMTEAQAYAIAKHLREGLTREQANQVIKVIRGLK